MNAATLHAAKHGESETGFRGARPLAGRVVVVTRPQAQAGSLAEAIANAGGEPLLFPTIEILETADVATLDGALSHLQDYAWAFFVSPNAVEKTFARVRSWPASVRVAAVGPGTRAALEQRGVREVTIPEIRFDSEALMELAQFAEVTGSRCVIFRGNGGRELIASTLRTRGAAVDLVECYRRAVPDGDAAALLARWSRHDIHAVTLTSSEGARNFAAMLGDGARKHFAQTPAFVPHARIAEAARNLGFAEVIETGAADAGLLRALCERFGQGAGEK
jgi:uroporphyrinogen-III synthase